MGDVDLVGSRAARYSASAGDIGPGRDAYAVQQLTNRQLAADAGGRERLARDCAREFYRGRSIVDDRHTRDGCGQLCHDRLHAGRVGEQHAWIAPRGQHDVCREASASVIVAERYGFAVSKVDQEQA